MPNFVMKSCALKQFFIKKTNLKILQVADF